MAKDEENGTHVGVAGGKGQSRKQERPQKLQMSPADYGCSRLPGAQGFSDNFRLRSST